MQLCPHMMDSQHMGQITTVSLSLVLLIQDSPSLQHVSKRCLLAMLYIACIIFTTLLRYSAKIFIN